MSSSFRSIPIVASAYVYNVVPPRCRKAQTAIYSIRHTVQVPVAQESELELAATVSGVDFFFSQCRGEFFVPVGEASLLNVDLSGGFVADRYGLQVQEISRAVELLGMQLGSIRDLKVVDDDLRRSASEFDYASVFAVQHKLFGDRKILEADNHVNTGLIADVLDEAAGGLLVAGSRLFRKTREPLVYLRVEDKDPALCALPNLESREGISYADWLQYSRFLMEARVCSDAGRFIWGADRQVLNHELLPLTGLGEALESLAADAAHFEGYECVSLEQMVDELIEDMGINIYNPAAFTYPLSAVPPRAVRLAWKRRDSILLALSSFYNGDRIYAKRFPEPGVVDGLHEELAELEDICKAAGFTLHQSSDDVADV